MLNEIFMTVPNHQVTGRCTYAISDLLIQQPRWMLITAVLKPGTVTYLTPTQ